MTDRRRQEGAAGEEALPQERIEVDDSGETLESALAEEERSAIQAAEAKLQSVQKDLFELRDRHLRKLAEIENMKKRSVREREEYYRQALFQFARDFLPILDHLDLAMLHATAEERRSDFGQGIGLIRRQLTDVWKSYGLTEVDTSGAFDPNVHQALATESSDELPPNLILEVLQKGYVLDDRLVRPAMVKVSSRETAGVERPDGREETDAE